jgi:type IV secretory pathway protease TraF
MIPTLKPGQRVLTRNWFYQPVVADLVVVRVDGRDIIKRVEKVEEEKLFLVGDNEKESTDSRKFGWIRLDEVIGKVVLIL